MGSLAESGPGPEETGVRRRVRLDDMRTADRGGGRGWALSRGGIGQRNTQHTPKMGGGTFRPCPLFDVICLFRLITRRRRIFCCVKAGRRRRRTIIIPSAAEARHAVFHHRHRRKSKQTEKSPPSVPSSAPVLLYHTAFSTTLTSLPHGSRQQCVGMRRNSPSFKCSYKRAGLHRDY